jgi:osmotically inducible protein OsmC
MFHHGIGSGIVRRGFMPSELDTVAKGSFEKVGNNFQITRIELETSGNVPGIDETTFQALAADAKQNCPVSKALAATEIKLKATLRQAETSRAPTDVAIQVTN